MKQGIHEFQTPILRVPLQPLTEHGLIIDLGGGGEGLVSRLGQKRVCAVDIQLDKIREARIHGMLSDWFLEDARSLGFRDGVFDVATFWFSLSYLRDDDSKRKALSEVNRILKPKGHLLIMGMNILCDERTYVMNAEFIFPDQYIAKMTYAVSGEQKQTMDSIIDLALSSGFDLKASSNHARWFSLKMSKY